MENRIRIWLEGVEAARTPDQKTQRPEVSERNILKLRRKTSTPHHQNQHSINSGLSNDVFKRIDECTLPSGRKNMQMDVNSNVYVKTTERLQQADISYAPACSFSHGFTKTEELSEVTNHTDSFDSDKFNRPQSPRTRLTDSAQLSGHEKSQKSVQEFSPRPHATSPRLDRLVDKVRSPRPPKYLATDLRSKSDNNILSMSHSGPKPTRSDSDHVTLPTLTTGVCRRHTFPSLLPTITVWEAEGSGPDTTADPSDFSHANLNLLLPIEHSTIVSSTLMQQRRRSLPTNSRTKLSVLIEEDEEKQSDTCSAQSLNVPRLRRRTRSLDDELSTGNEFRMTRSSNIKNMRF